MAAVSTLEPAQPQPNRWLPPFLRFFPSFPSLSDLLARRIAFAYKQRSWCDIVPDLLSADLLHRSWALDSPGSICANLRQGNVSSVALAPRAFGRAHIATSRSDASAWSSSLPRFHDDNEQEASSDGPPTYNLAGSAQFLIEIATSSLCESAFTNLDPLPCCVTPASAC